MLAADFLDGQLARHRGEVTVFGSYADTIADAAFWSRFAGRHEPSRALRAAAAAAWAAPAAAVTALSVARGQMTDIPRPALMGHLNAMLMGMHLPAATVTQIGALMSGHATNADVAHLMGMLPPSARAMVMNAMPVSAGHVAAGAILHFAYSGFPGAAFAMVIAAAMMMRVPLTRTAGGVVTAGVIGGAIVYAVMRRGLLPSVNPLMAFVPQTAFFLAHLLFGLVVGVVLAVIFRRRGLIGEQARP